MARIARALGNFLHRLFSDDFPKQGLCYLWQPNVLWMHVIADSVIAIAFVAMPLILLMVTWRRTISHRWILLLFCGFSLLCGMSHLFSVVSVWLPYYYLTGVLKAGAACASLAMTVMIFPLAPRILRALEAMRHDEAAEDAAIVEGA